LFVCLFVCLLVGWLVAYVLYYARASFSLGDLQLLVCLLCDVRVHVSSQVMMWSIVACLLANILVLLWMKLVCISSQLMFFCCLQRFSTYCYSVWCSYNFPKWSTVACRAGSPIIVSVWCSCMYLLMNWSTVACRGSPIRPQLCVCDMIYSDLCELCVCGMICSDLCICSWQCVFFSHCCHVTSRSAHALLCQLMGCRIEC
jgi:hypothetical protein